MRQAATVAAGDALEQLKREYRIRGQSDVAAYLRRHPDLTELLVEARSRLRNSFDEEPVALELVHDPDDPAEPELVASVRTALSSGEALRRLRRFDHEWWLGALTRTGAPVIVSIEHVA